MPPARRSAAGWTGARGAGEAQKKNLKAPNNEANNRVLFGLYLSGCLLTVL